MQVPPGPTPNSSTSGCESSDFAAFPPGAIAIIQRGTCTLAIKVANAQAAGASAVVIFNEGQPGRTDLFEGTLGGPGITIPVVSTTFAVGQQLYELRNSGLILRVATTADVAVCDTPPPVGTALPGMNTVVATPDAVTVGSEGPDVIYGSSGPDRIAAMNGDDLVFGLGGNDQITGGEGADTLCGGEGNDLLTGNAGSDLLAGGFGDDGLAGGAGDDTLYGGPGISRLAGGDGTDACEPDTASEVINCEDTDLAV